MNLSGSVVFEQVMILFFVMLSGFFACKRGILQPGTIGSLSEFLLKITMPCMIVLSFQIEYSSDLLLDLGLVMLISFAIHLSSAIAGWLLFRHASQPVASVLMFSTVFSNCGFMGFPVLYSIWGSEGVLYGSIYIISFNLFLWTYGITLFQGRGDWRLLVRGLANPGLIAVAIGLGLFLASLSLPPFLYQSIDLVGSLTTPLAMIIVGGLLADAKEIGGLASRDTYLGIVTRLMLVPGLTLLVLSAVGAPPHLIRVCVLLAAMPTAANTAIFAQAYGKTGAFASRLVALTTVLSVVTIPLFGWLMA